MELASTPLNEFLAAYDTIRFVQLVKQIGFDKHSIQTALSGQEYDTGCPRLIVEKFSGRQKDEGQNQRND